MRVLSLELRNVRQFKKQRLEFRPGFNLFVGENGAGKSTLLRSLLTVLPGAGNFRPSDRLSDDDIRRREEELHVSADFLRNNEKATVTYARHWRERPIRQGRVENLPIIWFGSNESVTRPFQWKKTRSYRTKNDGPDFGRDELMLQEEYLYREEFMEYPEDEKPPRFGASHVVRRFVGRALAAFSPKFERFTWRFVPYDCLIAVPVESKKEEKAIPSFIEEAKAEILRFFADQFPMHRHGWGNEQSVTYTGTGRPYNEKKRIRPLHEIEHLLQSAARRVKIRPDIAKVTVQLKLAPRIVIDAEGGPLRLSQLSDGEKRIFSIIVDIARQLSLQPGRWREIESASGIIVIDEIDCHLHPKWQRMIVKTLEDLFPACQFIATTHSPFVIQGVSPEQLQNLDGPVPHGFTDQGIDEIAATVMGVTDPEVSPRYLELLDVAKEYYSAVEDSKAAGRPSRQELRRRLDRLRGRFASRNPAFQAYLEMKSLGLLGPDA